MVASMDSSLDFYIKGLDFTLKNKWEPRGKIEWCWLQLDNASIMLQEYRELPAQINPVVGVSIYFLCEDALAIYHRTLSRGLQVAEPFVGNNMWVVGLNDPDGYKIYFESPTDVPEETIYSNWMKNI